MVYKMRFVQYFDKKNEDAFWRLEQRFVELEQKSPELKNGKRYIPVVGREPTNTMIWEADYPSMESAAAALKLLEESNEHSELLEEQICYMRDNYVEIYREIG